MKEEILRLLRSSEGYLSGQEICEALSISRTAVWKHINNLKKEGYNIEAVTNKGYILVENTSNLSKAGITAGINTKFVGREVIVYDEIDSTNNDAKKQAENGATEGTLIISDMQSAGKGRRGRVWSSPKNSGIFMTLILRPDMQPVKASQLTLVAGMAVRSAIRQTCGVEALIKWPNDMVYDGKKICGILTEMSADPDMINYVVIGIGINVNIENFPKEISNTATSLSLICGKKLDRNEIIAAFCNEFERYYNIFMKTKDMSGLVEEYNSVLVSMNKEIRVLDPREEYTGTSVGIDENGELKVLMKDGLVRQVMSGEVSVRGVYGYV